MDVDDSTPTRTLSSDPASQEEFSYADSVRTFIDVEYLATGCELYVYRYAGARSDQLVSYFWTHALTISSQQTVAALTWPEPLPGTYGRIDVIVQQITSGPKTAVFRVLQCCLAD